MKVLTFGEILLRLAAPGHTRLFQKDSLESSFCGGEANVAVSLALLGVSAQFLTKLPENDVAKAAVNEMRYFGVDTSKIVYGDGRVGIYYLEKGASQRPSKVIYDRKYSAIALAQRTDFDWDVVFEDIDWFHFTGITPALSDELAQICLEACQTAKKKGITISCDLNYRASLWSSEKARQVMPQFVKYVDVCIANEEDADKMLGICAEDTDIGEGKINKKSYVKVAEDICKRFGCQIVATTLRESYSASRNKWSAMLYDAETQKEFYSRTYDIQIVDRVGGGDSFAAGIIYGFVNRKPYEDMIEFATAASCLKHTLEGDFNRVSVPEVENLLKGDGSGRVQR